MQDSNQGDAAMAENQSQTGLAIPPFNPDGPLNRLKTLAEVQAKEATSKLVTDIFTTFLTKYCPVEVFIAEIHPKATKVACEYVD
jgi:hypothetical protein